MKLKRIFLRRKGINDDGPFTGSIEVNNAAGSIDMTLNEEEVAQILEICCDSLVRISQDAADRMREAILETVKPKKSKQ